MTEQEQKAIKWMKNVRDDAVVTLDHIAKEEPNVSPMLYAGRKEKAETIINGFEELEKYRAIGTVEELQKAEKEENILKFYYCDSEDSYLVGLRIGNYYYAHYIDGGWVFDMSRYLPWGEHVVDDTSAWKEHTYPSEPREINFSEWLNGFIKKECGGTPEECRASAEKQKEVRPKEIKNIYPSGQYECPICRYCVGKHKYFKITPFGETLANCKMEFNYCPNCGQKIYWSDEE